jgi:hypothetical protein
VKDHRDQVSVVGFAPEGLGNFFCRQGFGLSSSVRVQEENLFYHNDLTCKSIAKVLILVKPTEHRFCSIIPIGRLYMNGKKVKIG